MKTEKQVRTWWIADLFTPDFGEIPVAFKHHKNIKDSIHVIAHEDHLAIVAEYEQKIKTLSFALNEIKYLDTTEKRFNFIAETFEQLDKDSK